MRVKRSTNLANLTHWPKDKIERLRRVLKNEPLVHPDQLFVIERSLPHGHVELLLEAIRQLKLPALIDPRPSPKRDRVLAMILQRLLYPASKLATTRLWHTTTLAEELSLEDDEDDLYEASGCLSVRTALSASWPSGTWLKATRCMTSQLLRRPDLPPDAVHNRDGKRDRPIATACWPTRWGVPWRSRPMPATRGIRPRWGIRWRRYGVGSVCSGWCWWGTVAC